MSEAEAEALAQCCRRHKSLHRGHYLLRLEHETHDLDARKRSQKSFRAAPGRLRRSDHPPRHIFTDENSHPSAITSPDYSRWPTTLRDRLSPSHSGTPQCTRTLSSPIIRFPLQMHRLSIRQLPSRTRLDPKTGSVPRARHNNFEK